jgi:peptidoglycan/LPS O-acetylase OafA/YrhL
MNGKPDLRTVQALRAVACGLVVIYHAMNYPPRTAENWPNGAAGVDLFFAISGYVMMVSSQRLRAAPDGPRRFLAQRARRIVPLYWLCTAAKLACVALVPTQAAHTRPNFWSLAASLMFIPARDRLGSIRPVLPVGWTLNFEALFYILLALALAARVHPLWISPVLMALATAGFWRDPAWPAPLFWANGLVLEFAAGMALGCWQWRIPPRAAPWLMAAAAALLLALPSAGPWRFLFWGAPAAAILAACLALEPSVGGRLPAWLLAVGDASYAIYLVHPLIVPALARHGALAAASSVPLSLGAGLLVHRWLDAPLQRRLAGRRGASPPYKAGAGVFSG